MAERESIVIGENKYFIDELNPEQSALFLHLQEYDKQVNSARFNFNHVIMGRERAFDLLKQALESNDEPGDQDGD